MPGIWFRRRSDEDKTLHMAAYYERVERKKGDSKAIVAVAKEMLVIVWHMLSKQEQYRGVKTELYQRKLAKLDKLNSGLCQDIDG